MEGNLQSCKIILLGNGSVGKSSICARFKDDGFQKVYKQTVGIDWLERKLDLRGKSLMLRVSDVGGQSIGSSMMSRYIWGATVIFLCYDVTDAASFADVQDWLDLVERTMRSEKPDAEEDGTPASSSQRAAGGPGTGSATRPALYLVGNKVDLEHLRKIPAAMHDRFIADKKLDGGFFVSARSGDNVLSAFYQAVARQLGYQLTDAELESTRKVLGVTVAAPPKDEARTAYADEIERQDREAQARRDAAAKQQCCALQ